MVRIVHRPFEVQRRIPENNGMILSSVLEAAEAGLRLRSLKEEEEEEERDVCSSGAGREV